MARQRMVTRTVTITYCEMMCLNVDTAEVQVLTVALTGKITDKKTALKVYKKQAETETFKPVTCNSMTTEDVLYGMTEEQFLEHAKKLPPRKGTDDVEDETIEVEVEG